MSFYAWIEGEIRYSDRDVFEKHIDELKWGHWLDENNYWLDESNQPIEEKSYIDFEKMVIRIPYNHYKNLSYQVDGMIQSSDHYEVVWASNDGCFQGGYLTSGKACGYNYDGKVYDLFEFAVENNIIREDEEDEFDWQDRVIEEFMSEPPFDEVESIIPNLDSMDKDELRKWENYFSTLSRYCFNKQLAITERLNGNINNALAAERACEQEYKTLPRELQW